MAHIQVKNVPDHIHARARERARDEGTTLAAYVLRLIERDLSLPSQREWFATLATDEPVEGLDAVATLEAARKERQQHLGDAVRRR